MAPNKKKKAASNPARGFMTTSVPSKPKESETPTQAPKTLSSEDAASEPEKNTEEAPVPVPAVSSQETDLQKLSPDELEKHLHESELQLLSDKYGSKCRADSARQISRLESEKRVLQPQASYLSLVDWIPPELLDEILTENKQDLTNQVKRGLNAPAEDTKSFGMEETLCIRLWTLRETLLGLGFKESHVDETIPMALRLVATDTSLNKDMMWGLDQALEWLATYYDDVDLPHYRKSVTQPTRVSKENASETDTIARPDTTKPIASTGEEANKNSKKSPMTPEPEKLSSDESDTFSDDPDSLIPKYISLKTRLYRQRPDFNTKKLPKTDRPERQDSNPSIERLAKKIKKVESDVLFDEVQAEATWQQILPELREEAILSTVQQVNEKAPFSSTSKSELSSAPPVETSNKQHLDPMDEEPANDGDDIFTGLFGLEDAFPDIEVKPTEDTSVTKVIRDFGKPVGISPRRVLEDACRARDSSCKVSYQELSSTYYSNKKSVCINWTRNQPVLPDLPLDHVKYMANATSISVTMDTIATATAIQAESYISTVALFLVFSHSPKERKAYMKLSTAWKDLWDELTQEKKNFDDKNNRKTLENIQRVVTDYISTLEHDVVLTGNFKKRVNDLGTEEAADTFKTKPPEDPEYLTNLWTERAVTSSYKKMEIGRRALPIWSFREQILESLDTHQIVIICSETGSGKSTQIPSFILEHELTRGRNCKIYVTEPRRISATSLARRVSEELGENRLAIGTNRSLIGFAIRLESKFAPSTRLIFATTGVVVRMLERPKDFHDITHLVLDEIHERTIDGDFLLIILRRLLLERPDLKLILMSATVDASRFSKYLQNAPVLNIPGRTFPVEVKYLEDAVELTKHAPHEDPFYSPTADSDEESEPINPGQSNDLISSLSSYSKQTQRTVSTFDEYQLDYQLIVSLLLKICTDPSLQPYSQAILIFMPGMAEIRRLNDEILSEPFFNNKKCAVYALHSSIASDEQDKALMIAPPGIRKIVIATNIAETGITIPDVTAVIDSGKEKVMKFDEKRQFSKLVESFISRANAKQRRGRAGRVRNGICFHMFTRYRHDHWLAEQQIPEILRLSLQDLVLRVKICNLGDVEETLSEALDPPSGKNIRKAIVALKEVKALTNNESLTPLGRQLAKLPLDVFLGKLIIYGAIFSCLDAAVSIAAILSFKSPFVSGLGTNSQREAAKLSFRRGNSDLLTMYNAYLGWKRSRNTPGVSEYIYCRKHYLSPQALSNIEDIKLQLIVALIDSGLLLLDPFEQSALNRARFSSRTRQSFELPARTDMNSNSDIIVDSVIAWSFYPKLLIREGKGCRNPMNNQNVTLHPTSVNKRTDTPLKWLSFYHIMQGRNRNYNAHETSAVEDFAIALLCGDVEFKLYAGVLLVDQSRIKFTVEGWKSLLAIKTLSSKIREILVLKFKNPKKELSGDQKKWMGIWKKVFDQAQAKRQ